MRGVDVETSFEDEGSARHGAARDCEGRKGEEDGVKGDPVESGGRGEMRVFEEIESMRCERWRSESLYCPSPPVHCLAATVASSALPWLAEGPVWVCPTGTRPMLDRSHMDLQHLLDPAAHCN